MAVGRELGGAKIPTQPSPSSDSADLAGTWADQRIPSLAIRSAIVSASP
jgi:hypothetical protein